MEPHSAQVSLWMIYRLDKMWKSALNFWNMCTNPQKRLASSFPRIALCKFKHGSHLQWVIWVRLYEKQTHQRRISNTYPSISESECHSESELAFSDSFIEDATIPPNAQNAGSLLYSVTLILILTSSPHLAARRLWRTCVVCVMCLFSFRRP